MIKTTEKAKIELEFYRNCPEKHRPKEIYKVDEGIQYEKVICRHPTSQEDWNRVWKVGCNIFWLGLDVSSKEEFEDYGIRHGCKIKDVHPVRILHGCPRAEHIVMTDDICFISPREPEIVCREWDEAYLLMSMVTLWESWTRRWLVDSFRSLRPELVPPFEVTDVHRMFLLHHWENERSAISEKTSNDVISELKTDWEPVALRALMIEKVIA